MDLKCCVGCCVQVLHFRVSDTISYSVRPMFCLGYGNYSTHERSDSPIRRAGSMLWTIAVLLLILWVLGMVSSYTLGGFIHILLILAIITVLIRVIQGRSPVA